MFAFDWLLVFHFVRPIPQFTSDMKKLFIIGGIVVVLGLGAVLVVAFSLGSIVTTGVNKFAQTLTQTKVELASANISPFTASTTVLRYDTSG